MNLRIACLCGSLALGANATAQEPKPNIILFLVDDMGWQDTSVPFADEVTPWNRLYRTPHMEELARRGAKFTQAYAAHPVCSPTRTSMMTGKNPARTHIDDWVGHGYTKNRYLRSPKWAANGLQPDGPHLTLPSILQTNGYRTLHVGKAHFGGEGTAGANPTTLGFEVNIAGAHTGGPWGGWISPWLGKHKDLYPNLSDRPKGEYLTDAITAKATELIAKAAREKAPFFLNMAQFAVHTGIAPAPAYIDGYRDGRPKVEADYASMLEAMDASLGSILASLRDPDGDGDDRDSIADETLIVFTSDNGGLSNHTRATKGKVAVRSDSKDPIAADFERDWHNRPLRSGKGSAYEGGIRVPFLVAWAGQRPGAAPVRASLPIVPGSTIREPVHMDDFFATALDVAGIEDPVEASQRDGQSLLPLLRSRPFERQKPLFWHYPHQWYRDVGVGLGIEPFSAMRKGDFKVIYFYGDGVLDGQGRDPRVELYDLSQDLGESKDLSASQPERCMQLRDELVAWLKQVGAGIPIVRDTDAPAYLPARGEAIDR